jgi:hypothetical protein
MAYKKGKYGKIEDPAEREDLKGKTSAQIKTELPTKWFAYAHCEMFVMAKRMNDYVNKEKFREPRLYKPKNKKGKVRNVWQLHQRLNVLEERQEKVDIEIEIKRDVWITTKNLEEKHCTIKFWNSINTKTKQLF